MRQRDAETERKMKKKLFWVRKFHENEMEPSGN